jgi:DNA-binding CsgD family transcriptional regulator/tetratricopeptide (TPR) repeat protein
MANPLDKPVTCPVLIGRAAHLAALGRALEEVRGGMGRTVLLAGEAGIGKSRLVAEAKAWAAGAGCTILEGHCFESDRALPYAPFLDLLRAHLVGRSPDELAQALGPAAPELVKLLPELATLLPGLAPSPPLRPEAEKRRLYHMLAHFLAGLAPGQPLLLSIEDLHWSDETSLDFLLSLARRIPSHPLLLLLTYRSDEPHPSLSHFLAELDRERLATEVRLARLSTGEVELMLRAIFALDRPVRADLLHAIYTLTDGNPFFIEEVLRSVAAPGDLFDAVAGPDHLPLGEVRIPRSVEDAVQRRLARVSLAARDLLALAAVAGRRFDVTLLCELTQRDERALLPLLKEAIGAQLVVEESVDRFAFRHALTRQAVYRQLLARERRALHRRVAEAMERLYADPAETHVSDLAYQYYEAEVWPKALEYARRAGERAQVLHAPSAAVEHFTRALEAARHLAASPPIAVHRVRGLAYETLGEFDLARADHEAALAAAGAAGDRWGEWHALLDLGLLWAGRDYAQTGEFYRRALALARQAGDAAMLAHSLNRSGNWHLNVGEPQQAGHQHREALQLFRAAGNAQGVAQTEDLLGMTTFMYGNLVESRAHYERAIALFEDLGDRQALASALATLQLCAGTYQADTVPLAGTRAGELVGQGERAVRLAREIDWRSGEAYALLCLGLALGLLGDYIRALERVQQGMQIAQDIEHLQWQTLGHCAFGWIYLDVLALTEARRQAQAALDLANGVGSQWWRGNAASVLASVLVAQNDPDGAEAVLDDGFGPAVAGEELARRVTASRTLAERMGWRARAELALARGAPAHALAILDALIASAETTAPGQVVPPLWRLRGEARVALGRVGEAETTLLAARAAADRWGMRPVLWRIELALARLYHTAREEVQSRSALAAGLSVIQHLAERIPAGPLRDDFLSLAVRTVPRARPLTARQAAKAEFGGLTARERQVATLIVQGKTNRAIADALFVSERTVDSHVSSILTKLGLATRAQVAAWAMQVGLAVDPTSVHPTPGT